MGRLPRSVVLIMPGTLIIVAAFASILGMQMSLRCRTTVMAVMSSIGIVVGVCFGLGFCGFTSSRSSHKSTGSASSSAAFSPFTLITVLIDPYALRRATSGTDDNDIGRNRVIGLRLSAGSPIAAYAAIVWAMYKSMVKNFDMTIRKQSR